MTPAILRVDDVEASVLADGSGDSLVASKDAAAWADWVAAAQADYGFDLPTARRLAFARWLHLLGRLSDG